MSEKYEAAPLVLSITEIALNGSNPSLYASFKSSLKSFFVTCNLKIKFLLINKILNNYLSESGPEKSNNQTDTTTTNNKQSSDFLTLLKECDQEGANSSHFNEIVLHYIKENG